MTILEKVARAICECEGNCRNCDGAIQHFRGLLPDGTVHERDRACPYTKDATAAINAFLAAAAEPDEKTGISWHMWPDEATQRMQTRGMSEETPNWPAQSWRVMGEVAPEFEWGK